MTDTGAFIWRKAHNRVEFLSWYMTLLDIRAIDYLDLERLR